MTIIPDESDPEGRRGHYLAADPQDAQESISRIAEIMGGTAEGMRVDVTDWFNTHLSGHRSEERYDPGHNYAARGQWAADATTFPVEDLVSSAEVQGRMLKKEKLERLFREVYYGHLDKSALEEVAREAGLDLVADQEPPTIKEAALTFLIVVCDRARALLHNILHKRPRLTFE